MGAEGGIGSIVPEVGGLVVTGLNHRSLDPVAFG